jgi:predicted deacylase
MAVYDDEQNRKDDEQREALGNLYNSDPEEMRQQMRDDENGAVDDETDSRRRLRQRDQERDDEDSGNLSKQMGDKFLKAREEDAAVGKSDDSKGGGFYNATGDGIKDHYKATAGTKAKSSKRGKIAIGAAIGATTLGVGLIASFGNFFQTFKLEHIMETIQSSASARLNASFDGRSKSYMKAYFKLRMGEISDGNNYSGDNLFFKADKVQTGNPLRDWYSTLRTGSFEKNLLKNQGIQFTSVAVKDPVTGAVTLRSGKLTIKGESVDFKGLSPEDFKKIKSGDLNAVNKLGKDVDTFFKVEIFENNKAARKTIKKDINDATHFFNVIKRRHIRKDIQNKTGVGSWKLFEKTRNKFTARKIALQQKILRKVLPNNKTGDFLNCLLGSGPCGNSQDAAAPENQQNVKPSETADAAGTPEGQGVDAPSDQLSETGDAVPAGADPAGNPIGTAAAADSGALANDVAESVEHAAAAELTDDAARALENEGVSLIEKEATDNLTPSPTKIWSWAQKIAKLRNMFKNNTLSKFVTNWRKTQDIATAATFGIALSQGKSGELTAEEFGNFMNSVADISKSEGWNRLTDPSAQLGNDADKEKYCKLTDAEKAKAPIQYFCDSPRDSNANNLENSFNHSFVATLINPIADVVDAVKRNPVTNFLSDSVNFMGNFGGHVFTAIGGDRALSALLDATGASDQIGKLMTLATTKLMTYLGATARFSGQALGAVNYLMSGLSGSAEDTARTSGGVAATPNTTAYANNLAAQYQKEQNETMSFYDRFASLSNTSSLLSNTLFNFSTTSLSGSLMKTFSSLASLPDMLSAPFTGHSYAAAASNFSIAKWAGIDEYNIPPQCQETSETNPGGLNPDDSDYIQRAVGVVGDAEQAEAAQGVVNKIKPNLTIEIERDSVAFWKLVYDNIDDKTNQQSIAEAIYNCALVDQRVMSGLGYTSGATDDHGLADGTVTTTPASPPTTVPTTPTPSTGAGLNGLTVPCIGKPTPVTTLSGPRADWSKAPTLGNNFQGQAASDSGTVGTNSAGQAIKVYIREACDATNLKTLVVGGGIHGTENGGGLVAWDLLYNATLPANVRVVAIPEINSYGINKPSRKNANGVDLNRNFNYSYGVGDPESCAETDPSCMFYKGTAAESEPETKALVSFLPSLGKVDLFIIYHDKKNYVAPVGNTPIAIGNAYASVVGMHGKDTAKAGTTSTVTQHGSLDGWFNSTSSHPLSILVELGEDQSAQVITKHVNALQQMFGPTGVLK